ncbi:MAG: zinc ribbon domain-containing protein [Spirochaetota bacterium]
MSKVKDTMVQLQRHNDSILRACSEIESARQRIRELELKERNRIAQGEKLAEDIKLYRKTAHLLENDLSSVDEHIRKIDSRMNEASSQKEYAASETEKEKAAAQKSRLEDSILQKMEELSLLEDEKASFESTSGIDAEKAKVESDILVERIRRFEKSSDDHRIEFERLLLELPQQYRSRFQKLARAKDGRAIAELSGNACSGCNYSVPTSDINRIRDGETVSCTNCGRFVFDSLPQ